MTTTIRRAAIGTWIAFLVGTILAMTALGATSSVWPRLEAPRSAGDLTKMLSSMEVLAALARLGAVTVAGWLLLTTVAVLALERTRNRPASTSGGVGAAAVLRSLSQRSPGFVVALLTSSVITAGAAHATSPGTGGSSSAGREASANPTMELLSPDPGVATHMPWAPESDAASQSQTGVHSPEVVAAQSTHVVSSGEHLWSIAEDTVRRRLGPAAEPAQVSSYWLDLIDENRDRLADPGNPDFILPGQVLKLPV